jgi:hypothetical protein
MRTRQTRRQLVQTAIVGCVALWASHGAAQTTLTSTSGNAMQLTEGWDKTFKKSDKVDHQKVTFKNRYGITLAGDLYLPKNRSGQRLAALVISGPFGAVKEQSSGLYAQNMAERGFVTLAFDPSYTGKAAASPAMSPHRTSIPKISAPLSTILACTPPSTASGSASSAFAAGAAWL